MRFVSPEWFLLLPLFIAAGWFWRGLRLQKPLRLVALLLVMFVLAKPEIRRQGDGLDLWVLVDQSESARDVLQPKLQEWESILDKSRGRHDRIYFVDFADEAVKRGAQLRSGQGGQQYAGARSATRVNSAIRHVLSQRREKRASRLLLFSDGYSTEPLDGLGERLVQEEVALDYRLAGDVGGVDYRVAALQLPRRVQLGEAFLAEVVVVGSVDGVVPLNLKRNGLSIGDREIEVIQGVGRLRFTDRLTQAGAYEYEVQLLPDKIQDAHPGNNRAAQWVEVQGGPKVVLATAYQNDPMEAILRAQGFAVEVVNDIGSLHIGKLSGAKVVLFNNVPAYEMNPDFIKGLNFFVNQQGGGMAMIGGKRSFAAGGWFGSALEPLLPVSMELKQEHRKLAIAMAIVMDRSGSMAMTAPGTSIQKMQLANEGAARAIGLLGDNDMVSVLAVDSTAHKIAPLTSVAKNRGTLQNAARRVQSAGGGIFVYQGLKSAWAELKHAPVGQRHIILFADAADAEEPGEYVKLLQEMRDEKATVSVIGLGSDKDTDAAFLQDVAKRGEGRIFFNANPNELPALFAQETVAVARSAFIEEPVEIKGTPGWMEMAAGKMDWPPSVDGYNLSYLRPGATQAAISGDEYQAPLVAFWQRGAGRTAAISFPLGGEFSEKTRAWPEYGGFVQSVTRWLMGEQEPSGIGLRTQLEGSRLFVDLYYDQSWNEKISANGPQLILAEGNSDNTKSVVWERLEPGRFRAAVDLTGTGYLRGAVRVGGVAFPFGPINAVINPEWAFSKTRLKELQELSLRSGGSERVDLSDVWHAPRSPAWSDLQNELLAGLLVMLLLEALQTRTGWNPWRSRKVSTSS